MSPSDNSKNLMVQTEEMLKMLSSALRSRRLYPKSHPIFEHSCKRLVDQFNCCIDAHQETWTIVLLGGEFVYEKIPLPKISALVRPLYRAFDERRIESISIKKGVTLQEMSDFIDLLIDAETWKKIGVGEGILLSLNIKNISFRRVKLAQKLDAISTSTGIARSLFQNTKTALKDFFVSFIKSDQEHTIKELNAVVETLLAAMQDDRYALISRIHTRHAPDDLVSHGVNTGLISYILGKEMGIDDDLLGDLLLAGLVHNIGMVDENAEVLRNAVHARPNDALYKRHPVRGMAMLKSVPGMPSLAEVAAFEHHMQYDGNGFPASAPGTVNPAGQIVSLAGFYDNLLHSKEHLPLREVPKRLIALAGTEFNPQIIWHFLNAFGVYPPGTYIELSTGDKGLVVETNKGEAYRPIVKLLETAPDSRHTVDTLLNLVERDPSTGGYIASILKSIPPNQIAVPETPLA